MDSVPVNSYAIGPGADLTGARLAGADLSGSDLTGSRLVGADLREANLDGATLTGVDLSQANLAETHCYNTDFARSNLRDAVLIGAGLWYSDLSGANLVRANLSGATCGSSDVSGANLTEADLTEADLSFALDEAPDGWPVSLHGAVLRGAILDHAKLRNALLPRVDLSRADLWRTDLHGAQLCHANFTEALLLESDFTGSDLRNATFIGTRITFVYFTRADLTEAYFNLPDGGDGQVSGFFTGARLTRAHLAGADLRWDDLDLADLEGANLEGADLEDASLKGSNLTEANLARANLSGVTSDDNTIWPDDFTREATPASHQNIIPADRMLPSQEIEAYAETQGITRLCHFTRIELLSEIFRRGRILPTSDLLSLNPGCTRNDLYRRDHHLDYVSCSIQYPNLWVLDKFRNRYPDTRGWAILVLRPDPLWKSGTLFSPVNAAQDSGHHACEGLAGLEGMFQPNPPARHPRSRGSDHLPNCPTDNQAEVLVPDGIPTTDVVGIILETKRLCIDLELDLFSIPSSDGQSRVFVPGSPWVESNPELFSKEHLKACIWNGVEIPVRPER